MLANWWTLIVAWAVLAALFALLWWRQTRTRNATSVDLAWSLGIAVVTVVWLALGTGDPWRRLLVGVLLGGWMLRLAWHVWADRMRGEQAEDGRYGMLRERFARHEQAAFFGFYQLQALFVLFFALPGWIMADDPRPVGTLADAIAVGIWCIALAGEWLADRQLARWRRDPDHRGRTCRDGLWRYSRHPNYFFEWIHWFTYPVLALGFTPGCALWALPVGMLLLITRVTGIPYTERRALQSRGEDYRRYMQETPPFIPWFPRRPAAKEVQA
ncbi:MAG: DUF1295 domain-containing protein [Planctomycetota bacterium]